MKMSWKQIEKALKAEREETPLPPATEFWADFKARAKLCSQDTVEPRTVRQRRGVLAWASAAACTVLVGIGVVWCWLIGSTSVVMATEVTALEVDAVHSAVIIMNDKPEDGTIVWIVDMEDGEGGGV